MKWWEPARVILKLFLFPGKLQLGFSSNFLMLLLSKNFSLKDWVKLIYPTGFISFHLAFAAFFVFNKYMFQFSRFQMAAHAPLPRFIPEIFRFEMILAWMSHIYEFFKSIALFKNSMWKSWLLATKLHARIVTMATIFIMSSRSGFTKALLVLALAKEARGIFKPWKVLWK